VCQGITSCIKWGFKQGLKLGLIQDVDMEVVVEQEKNDKSWTILKSNDFKVGKR
jgi:hypothetical protein